MDIVPTSAGFALVDNDGVVVSVHPTADDALHQMTQQEYAQGGANPRTATAYRGGAQAMKPSLSSPAPKISAPPGAMAPAVQKPIQKPAQKAPIMKAPEGDPNELAVKAALERSRQPLKTALDAPEAKEAALEVPPIEISDEPDKAPSWKVGKRGKDHVLFEDGHEVARFANEDKALEHMNLRKYAWQQGLDAPESPSARPMGAPMAPATRWGVGEAPPIGEQGPKYMSRKYGADAWEEPKSRAASNPWAGMGEEAEKQFAPPEEEEEKPKKFTYAPGQGLTEG